MTTAKNTNYIISGILVIDKPVGMYAHQVVKKVSHMLGIKRVGHIGSLDPHASGVLVLAIGPSVRLSQYLNEPLKKYQLVIKLSGASHVTEKMVITALTEGVGSHDVQTIPTKKTVEITHLELLEFEKENLEENEFVIVVDMHCSSGSYLVQTVANLATRLNCTTSIIGTRRTRSGKFTLKDAVNLEKLAHAVQKGDWHLLVHPAAEVIEEMPAITLSDETIALIQKGNLIPAKDTEIEKYRDIILGKDKQPSESTDCIFRLVSTAGELIALICLQDGFAEYEGQVVWRPIKNFMSEG